MRSSFVFVTVGLGVGVGSALIVNYLLSSYLTLGLEGALRDYIIAVALAIGVGGAIFLLPGLGDLHRDLLLLWGLRCGVTLGAMLVYERFYVILDAFTYYRIASFGIPHLQDLSNGTENLTYGLALIINNLPLLKSYQAVKVIFSFMGLTGGFFFWRAYVLMTGEEDRRLLWILCAFPSILFWSSILGKDPIVFMGLGIFTWGAVQILRRPSWRGLIGIAVGMAIVSLIRLWVGCVVMLALALTYLTASQRQSGRAGAFKLMLLAGSIFVMGIFMDRLRLSSQDDVYGRINTVSRGWSSGGSQQEVPELNTPAQIIRFLPQGMFSSLYRPFPGEVNNMFGILSGFENLILLFLGFYTLKNLSGDFLRDRNVRFMGLLILLWSMLYSVISYQNLGTAVRFKTQVLPFMLMLPFYLAHLKRLKSDRERVFGEQPKRV